MVANRLKRGIEAISKDQPGAAAGFLRPIDTKRIAEDLNLERVAAENGTKNAPPTDSVNLDSVEQTIVQRIEGEWTWHGGELVNHLRAYASRLIGFAIRCRVSAASAKGHGRADTAAQRAPPRRGGVGTSQEGVYRGACGI